MEYIKIKKLTKELEYISRENYVISIILFTMIFSFFAFNGQNKIAYYAVIATTFFIDLIIFCFYLSTYKKLVKLQEKYKNNFR